MATTFMVIGYTIIAIAIVNCIVAVNMILKESQLYFLYKSLNLIRVGWWSVMDNQPYFYIYTLPLPTKDTAKLQKKIDTYK